MNRSIMWVVMALVIYTSGVMGFLLMSWSYRGNPRYLTADTITHFALKRFNRADNIVDGTLLYEEFCGRVAAQTDMREPCRRHFRAMDTNHDGNINSMEMVDFYLSKWRTADQNEDGRVTEEEWFAAMQEN
jgi:Ca2+-binding EF-hand superfamily protein